MSTDWIALEKQYYAQTVRRQPVVLVRGQGTHVWDADGKEYLDFIAGWAVTNLGHCHPAMVEAIQEQAATLIQTSNQFYTVPQLQLAQILVDNSCLDKRRRWAKRRSSACPLSRTSSRGWTWTISTSENRSTSTCRLAGRPDSWGAFLLPLSSCLTTIA